MAGFELIIFDCDGVLVDSEIIAAQVESKLLTDAGYPISAEELAERFAGLTWKDILFEVEREASIPFSATLLDASETLLDKKLAAEVRAIDGAAQAIARIGGQRCICSNSSSHRLKAMLARTGLDRLFGDHVYSAKDVGEGRTKPAPDVFLHGARQFDAKPGNVLVIEDSVHGVHAATAAGMRVSALPAVRTAIPGTPTS
jgi:HAD superfamily hydrolase (TIGR01509 family)